MFCFMGYWFRVFVGSLLVEVVVERSLALLVTNCPGSGSPCLLLEIGATINPIVEIAEPWISL